MSDKTRQPAYLPTPEEIEQMCEEIRSQWDDNEREDRARAVAGESKSPVQHEDET